MLNLLIFCLFFSTSILVPLVEAFHFRFGSVAWRQLTGGQGRLFEFDFQTSWKYSHFLEVLGYDTLEVGDVVEYRDITINSINSPLFINLTSININEDYFIGETRFQHEFEADGVSVVQIVQCCRFDQIENIGDDTGYRVATAIFVQQYAQAFSPVPVLLPIIHIADGQTANFQVPITRGSDPILTYALTNPGTATANAGSLTLLPGMTVGEETGIVEWFPTGPGLYAVSVTITTYANSVDQANGEYGSISLLDFIINVASSGIKQCKSFCSNPGLFCESDADCFSCIEPTSSDPFASADPPYCAINSGPYFTQVLIDNVDVTPSSFDTSLETTVTFGITTSIMIFAQDDNPEDDIFITATSPPPGMTFVKNVANPGSIEISYTPTIGNYGTFVCFSASDPLGKVSIGLFCISFLFDPSTLSASGAGVTNAVAGVSNSFTIIDDLSRFHAVIITGQGITVNGTVTPGSVLGSEDLQEYLAEYGSGDSLLTKSGSYVLSVLDISEGSIVDPPLFFDLIVAPGLINLNETVVFERDQDLGLSGGSVNETLSLSIQIRDQFQNDITNDASSSFFVTTFSEESSGGISNFSSVYIGNGIFSISYDVPDIISLANSISYSIEVYHLDTFTGDITLISTVPNLTAFGTSFSVSISSQFSVTAGEPFVVTFQVPEGNTVSSMIRVVSSLQNIVADSTDGKAFNATFSPILKSGTYLNEIRVIGSQIISVGASDLIVSPSIPSASSSNFSYPEGEFAAGDRFVATIQLFDEFGNRIFGNVDDVDFSLTGSNKASGNAVFRPTTNDYVIDVGLVSTGATSFSATLVSSGDSIASVSFIVEGGSFSISRSLIRRASSHVAGDSFQVTLQTFDAFGNEIDCSSRQFIASLVALSNAPDDAVTKIISLDSSGSTCFILASSTVAGYHQFTLRYRTDSSSSPSTLSTLEQETTSSTLVTSFSVLMEASLIVPEKSLLSGKGLVGGDASSNTTIYIQGSDQYGNAIRNRSDSHFVVLIESTSGKKAYLANYFEPNSLGFCGFNESLANEPLEVQVLSANGFWSIQYPIPRIPSIGDRNYSVTLFHTTSANLNLTAYEQGEIPVNHLSVSSEIAVTTSFARDTGADNSWIPLAIGIFVGIIVASMSGYAGWRMYRYRSKYLDERRRADSLDKTLEEMDDETFNVPGYAVMDWQAVGAANISMNPLHKSFRSRGSVEMNTKGPDSSQAFEGGFQ